MASRNSTERHAKWQEAIRNNVLTYEVVPLPLFVFLGKVNCPTFIISCYIEQMTKEGRTNKTRGSFNGRQKGRDTSL